MKNWPSHADSVSTLVVISPVKLKKSSLPESESIIHLNFWKKKVKTRKVTNYKRKIQKQKKTKGVVIFM